MSAALLAVSVVMMFVVCESGDSIPLKSTGNGEVVGGDGDFGRLTDSRDGKSYRTVRIGSQTWMAQNLNYAGSGNVGLCPDNHPDTCAKYGRLYDWATAMGFAPSCNDGTCASQILAKHQGICPSGWHIPSVEDIVTLREYVGHPAGVKLKATSGWNMGNGDISNTVESGSNLSRPAPPMPPPVPGTDEFGFSALPTYNRNSIFSSTLWWSATEHEPAPAGCRHCNGADHAYSWGISNNIYTLGNFFSYKNHEVLGYDPYPVRCLRN